MRSNIERIAIYDCIDGAIIGDEHNRALTITPYFNEQVAPLYMGNIVVKYAIQYLGKPQYCIVPELIALERGATLNGEEAWDFLLNRSNLYPRADVFGYRNDGADEMIVVKKLDLAIPVEMLLYTDIEARSPIARTRAFIGDFGGLSARIQTYFVQYSTVENWRLAINP